MARKQQLKIRMIALGPFIDSLIEIYNSGADFIDLIGDPSDGQDKLGIFVKKEYMNENRSEEESYIFEKVDDEEFIVNEDFDEQSKLTDDDINQLLQDE